MTRQYRKNRKYYGYDKMELGQVKVIECADFDEMVTARTSAYMCGKKYGRIFRTTFDIVGDVFDLKIKRVL